MQKPHYYRVIKLVLVGNKNGFQNTSLNTLISSLMNGLTQQDNTQESSCGKTYYFKGTLNGEQEIRNTFKLSRRASSRIS